MIVRDELFCPPLEVDLNCVTVIHSITAKDSRFQYNNSSGSCATRLPAVLALAVMETTL